MMVRFNSMKPTCRSFGRPRIAVYCTTFARIRFFGDDVGSNFKQSRNNGCNLSPLRGVYPVMITPFHNNNNESIDFHGFRKCLTFMQNHIGCSGVTISGVLGEANRMTDFEKQLLVENAVHEIKQQNKKSIETSQSNFRLVVGVTHTGTAATIAMCQMASELGADAVMISPTKDGGSHPTNDNIYYVFEQIARSCPNTTIVLQDHPSSSGVHLSIDLMVEILTNIPQVTTIKLESIPTISRLSALRDKLELKENSYSLLTGLGALYAGFDLIPLNDTNTSTCTRSQRQSDGFMTGFAFPEILMTMYELVHEKQYDKARQIYEKYLPLIVLEQQPGEGLAIRKEIYRHRGLISSCHVRHPGKNVSSTIKNVLDRQLANLFPKTAVDIKRPITRDVLEKSI